ncbi:MAG: AbrB/MazE/SpoVT family DNA-binding domain-containing protein [Acidobacteriota bacterium]
MTLKIDGAGRIVLPKPVRDRLGLKAGTDLEIQVTAEAVVLTPVARRPSLVRAGRFLVHAGKAPAGSSQAPKPAGA